MPKFTLTPNTVSNFPYQFDATTMHLVKYSAKSVEYADEAGNTVVYTGRDVKVDGEEPTGGNIKKVEFFSADGDLWMTISDAAFHLNSLSMTNVLANFDVFAKGDDTFIGSANADFLIFGSNKGNDKISGLGGNDYIYGSDGNNVLDGGAGDRDSLVYASIDYAGNPSVKGVTVNLAKGEATNPWGKTDTISGIEQVLGTKFSDRLIGSARDEFLYGYQGNDTFTGGKGDDTFGFSEGGGGDVVTDFGKGNDSMVISIDDVTNFEEFQALMVNGPESIIVNFGDGDTLTFANFFGKRLEAENFTFLIES